MVKVVYSLIFLLIGLITQSFVLRAIKSSRYISANNEKRAERERETKCPAIIVTAAPSIYECKKDTIFTPHIRFFPLSYLHAPVPSNLISAKGKYIYSCFTKQCNTINRKMRRREKTDFFQGFYPSRVEYEPGTVNNCVCVPYLKN